MHFAAQLQPCTFSYFPKKWVNKIYCVPLCLSRVKIVTFQKNKKIKITFFSSKYTRSNVMDVNWKTRKSTTKFVSVPAGKKHFFLWFCAKSVHARVHKLHPISENWQTVCQLRFYHLQTVKNRSFFASQKKHEIWGATNGKT